MGLRTLLFVYLLGGLTFLPLLLATVCLAAWKLLPRDDDHTAASAGGNDGVCRRDAKSEELARRAKEDRERQESIGEAAASGTFAVLRRYDFQAAIGAFNARNTASNAASTTNVAADATTPGDGSSASVGESVYQSMYRSVFAGKQNNSSTTSLLQSDESQPASVVYIVLRHGHLMLYDSPAQVEVKHVLSLAHHRVTLQAGKDGDDADERLIPEADLFIKRTAIVLTPVELPNGALQRQSLQTPAKPFYLFSATNIEKEDFYHALLYARSKPPVPRPLDSDALIKLQSALHSSSLTSETRALNALLGRVFLGIHHGERLVELVRAKIERKLNRIQKPNYITTLRLRGLDLGDAGPILTNLKLRDLNISGDTTISADVRYSGGLSITLLAVAKLDLGQRFKTRTVDLVLKTSLKRVQGTMLLHIKPPPSNRLWFTFESMPELEIRVEPVVSERKITYGFVLRAIEERVRAAIAEGLVKPNWDDVPFPMQDTRESSARGGSWSDEGQEEHLQPSFDAAKFLAERNEKTKSVPDFQQEQDTATSTSLWSNSDLNVGRLRHASTLPPNASSVSLQTTSTAHHGPESGQHVERFPQSTARTPNPLRSPSISSSSPSVAVDGQTVEPVRSDDPLLQPTSAAGRKIWRPRGTQQPQQKDALDELRDLRDRAKHVVANPSSLTTSDGEDSAQQSKRAFVTDADESDDTSIRSRQKSASSESTVGTTPRTFSLLSTDTDTSSAAPSTSSSSSRVQQTQQRKANIIAAAGAATNAAKNWGWNAIQRNKNAFPRTPPKAEPGSREPKEPMGRGQPLPPPGQPLPGPPKAKWGTTGNMKRKPVPNLPPRRSDTGATSRRDEDRSSNADVSSATNTSAGDDGIRVTAMEDEFGTWQENVVGETEESKIHADSSSNTTSKAGHQAAAGVDSSGSKTWEEDLLDLRDPSTTNQKAATSEASPNSTREVAPPLPARRRQNASGQKPAKDAVDTSQTTSNKAEESDDSESGALKVPESAASAIAAENSTPALAHSTRDHASHVDTTRGVESEVLPNQNINTFQSEQTPKVASNDHSSHDDLTLRRTDTDDRFLRGENVHEEDFKDNRGVQNVSRSSSQPQDGTTSHLAGMSVPMSLTKDDDLAKRIKAQVEKHSQGPAESSSGHTRRGSDITPATGW